MKRVVNPAISALVFAAAALLGTGAMASTNVALSSDGASFVTASSFNTYAITGCGAVFCGTTENGGLPTMEADVITNTPIAWLSDGDTRYIFANGDENQSITIDLGQDRSLASFGVTFDPADRAVIGPFSVETSLNGITWTPQGATIANPASGPDLIDLASRVEAQYVMFSFGPTSPQYGGDGSGVSQVFANAVVPEPATWAMMLVGFGGLGAAMRARRSKAVATA
jgi:hypothetical protein